MTPEAPFTLEEVAGRESSLTQDQRNHLAVLDWYIDTELTTVVKETKESGQLQAYWKHTDRMNKFLLEGIPMIKGTEYKP